MNVEKIPDIWLQRYLLDELPPAERDRVSQALDADRTLETRLEELKRSGEEFLRRYPPEVMAARARRAMEKSEKPTKETSRVLRLAVSPIGLAFAVVVLAGISVELLRRDQPGGDPADEEVVRIKGEGPKLFAFRKKGNQIEELRPGATVAKNDIIQLSYQPAGARFGAILSLDGRGTITQHLPGQGTQAAELVTGSAVPLAFAYRLDDAPKAEIFFFVTSDKRFALETIRNAVARSGSEWQDRNKRLPLPAQYQQFVLSLQKENK